MRQAPQFGLVTEYDPQPGVSISTLAYEYPPGFNVPEHSHGSDQLIYAIRGVMEVASGPGLWLIPPLFAIWIPANTTHNIRMPGAVSMRTLYLRPGLAPRLPSACMVLQVTAVRLGELRWRNSLHCALRDLIVSHLQEAAGVPSFVTLPKDPRALLVAQTVMANPRCCGTFQVICEHAGASTRTIERIFRREVGLNFESWRRQFRLMKAIELLNGGCSVKEVAFEIGYRRPSAFVEVFRRTLGATPKVWAATVRNAD
jgi:AraC-like DNA-binding protein